jgi:quinol monooxygenase YgiN
MVFRPDQVTSFVTLFEERKERIRNFEGCTHLELLQDISQRNIFFTYSYWIDTEALEAYRNSELFADTWERTKAFFSEKAMAWSVERKFVLN